MPGPPALLATDRLAESVRDTPSTGVYETVWRRQSSPFPFSGRPPPDLLAELTEAPHQEGAIPCSRDATTPTGCSAPRGRRKAATGRTPTAQPRAADRSVSHTPGRWDFRHRLWAPQGALDRMPTRDFGARRRPDLLPARAFETRPTLAALSTAHDRRADWLRAGQALEGVLLLATRRAVRASLHHQATEWPDLRQALEDLPTDGQDVSRTPRPEGVAHDGRHVDAFGRDGGSGVHSRGLESSAQPGGEPPGRQ